MYAYRVYLIEIVVLAHLVDILHHSAFGFIDVVIAAFEHVHLYVRAVSRIEFFEISVEFVIERRKFFRLVVTPLLRSVLTSPRMLRFVYRADSFHPEPQTVDDVIEIFYQIFAVRVIVFSGKIALVRIIAVCLARYGKKVMRRVCKQNYPFYSRAFLRSAQLHEFESVFVL